jgi:hypothetical protein
VCIIWGPLNPWTALNVQYFAKVIYTFAHITVFILYQMHRGIVSVLKFTCSFSLTLFSASLHVIELIPSVSSLSSPNLGSFPVLHWHMSPHVFYYKHPAVSILIFFLRSANLDRSSWNRSLFSEVLWCPKLLFSWNPHTITDTLTGISNENFTIICNIFWILHNFKRVANINLILLLSFCVVQCILR